MTELEERDTANIMFSKFCEEASQESDAVASTLSLASAMTKKKRRRQRKVKHSESAESFENTGTSDKKRKSVSAPVPPQQSKRRRRQVPSEEALALSAKLKELSSQKRLDEALELYWHESNDSIRDGHHACIVVDCSARCGAIVEGEKIIAEMRKAGMYVNIETETALLKGYSHSGMMHKGATLFAGMCLSKERRNRPNIRTLNTLLRGCLWTATTGDAERLAGGIVTSEESWKLFRSCVSVNDLDCSSYEYYIGQLCYALRVDEAKDVIDELKRKYNMTNDAKLSEAEPSIVESLAISLVALARGMILLNQHDEAAAVTMKALQAAETAKRLLQGAQQESSHQTPGSTGGKRGWKTSENSSSPRREVSNSLFRSHRLSEVGCEASDLLSICSLRPKHVKLADLAFYLVTRLLYFSGGGTTDLSVHQRDNVPRVGNDSSRVRCQLMNSIWHSFGLRTVLMQLLPDADWVLGVSVFSEQDLLSVRRAVGSTDASVIFNDGFIDFREVFKSRSSAEDFTRHQEEARPLDIELGSGFGDWVVHQAMCNPERDYVAVELRADRVAQTFSKAFLNGSSSPLSNVCCVGSECGSFLRTRVRHGSVATIFVNHPEPPTQTYGSNSQRLSDIAEGGNEPAHMLNSDTLVSASRCLRTKGRLIIVTDNRWYARLICVTLLKAMKLNRGLICSSKLGHDSGIRHVETFGDPRRDLVILYEGQPSETICHSLQSDTKRGGSYFDRLWRSGAGSHAERNKRFIISMDRAQFPAYKPSTTIRSKAQPNDRGAKDGKEPKKEKKNRKKTEAKQKRRNERRLAKREAAKEHTVD